MHDRKVADTLYSRPVFQLLVDSLPCIVEAMNVDDGADADAPQNELVVQREIARLLKARLPCATLVHQNRMLIRDEKGACIPDVIIDRIGGGCWAAIELKLKLPGDRLTRELVTRDIEKLARYKAFYPSAHCIFLLVASLQCLPELAEGRGYDVLSRLLNDGMALDQSASTNFRRGDFDAYECARSRRAGPMQALAWEIARVSSGSGSRAFDFRFSARMLE